MAKAPNPKRPRIDDSLDFIEKPSQDFHCPVTVEVLTEPHQTLCCGNHLSQEAADRLKQEGKPCPICNEPNLNTVHDKFFKRMVNQLKVRCSKKALGCNWVGELRDLERHLSVGSVDGECQFVTVTCPLSCGDCFQRGQLEGHKSTCPNRSFMCEYCGYEDTYKIGTEVHSLECEKHPIQCPNKCGENALIRKHLKQHLDNFCPLQLVACEFSYAGCEFKCQQQEMQKHLDENMQSHLTMASAMIKFMRDKDIGQDEKIQSLTHQVSVLASALNQVASALNQVTGVSLTQPPSPVFIPPPAFVMTDFGKHKNDGDKLYSPPFYSHIGGYKLCISVGANGWGNGTGTHVSVAVNMMRGEYDDNLKWPFKGEVRVQLFNQRGNKGHLERAPLELSHYSQDHFDESKHVARVVGREIAEEGWGLPQFIAHTDLAYNRAKNCQYLMNHCLKFGVAKIELAP